MVEMVEMLVTFWLVSQNQSEYFLYLLVFDGRLPGSLAERPRRARGLSTRDAPRTVWWREVTSRRVGLCAPDTKCAMLRQSDVPFQSANIYLLTVLRFYRGTLNPVIQS
jgi:hypothetical protein